MKKRLKNVYLSFAIHVLDIMLSIFHQFDYNNITAFQQGKIWLHISELERSTISRPEVCEEESNADTDIIAMW